MDNFFQIVISIDLKKRRFLGFVSYISLKRCEKNCYGIDAFCHDFLGHVQCSARKKGNSTERFSRTSLTKTGVKFRKLRSFAVLACCPNFEKIFLSSPCIREQSLKVLCNFGYFPWRTRPDKSMDVLGCLVP